MDIQKCMDGAVVHNYGHESFQDIKIFLFQDRVAFYWNLLYELPLLNRRK